MKFKKVYYLFAIAFYLFAVLVHITWEYINFKKDLYQTIDTNLKTAAYTVPQVLPIDYHGHPVNKTSLSLDKDNENITRLSSQAKLLKVKFIYSLVQQNDKIYFTSCSSNEQELQAHKEVHFFDPYDDAPLELSRTFSSKKLHYAEYTDQWGTFRSIFIPMTTHNGYQYVIAADVDISSINEQLNTALINSLFDVLFYILILAPIFSLYRRHMNEITFNQELVIMQRTKELTVAKEAAEASEHAKSDFLATMSHEIRTPMNGVLGMLSLLERSDMTPTQSNQVRIAISSATSLLGLINDILDFSKIEAGKMDLENIEFDLVHELNDFTEAIAFKAHEKGLEFNLDTSNLQNPVIIADSGRIRQILTNLIGNAVKFTHEGSITIKASLVTTNDSLGRLQLNVIDTGIGIPQSKLQSLFDPFTQADGSTTRKYGGTGLGLSIVKSLCTLMNGTISVQSTLEKGSIFNVDVEVGLSTSKMANTATTQPPAETYDADVIWPVQTRILLVEDNPTNQIVAQGILESIGLYADIAGNGLEALEALKLSTHIAPYSLILMDCQMPEMDGYEASRNIRAAKAGEENTAIPIIAMTANAMSGDREQCIAAGMNDYISKPIDITVLKNALIKWLLNGRQVPLEEVTHQTTQESKSLLWDKSEALTRLGGKEKLLERIVLSFLKEAPSIIKALSLAIKKEDFTSAQLHAHSLKGSAANIGATQFSEIAKKIELAAKEENLTVIKELYPLFKESYYATVQKIEEA
jgi:signal transduction histidine kinase/CheY-like chemotaxis protein/HPt (histidine-containing phosphotransfer) domain-containing protein